MSGLVSLLKIFWLEANLNIELVTSIIVAQGLLFLSAYSDFGLNQGILYIGMGRKVRNGRQAAISLIQHSYKKLSILLFIFLGPFLLFLYTSLDEYNFNSIDLLSLSIVTISYLVAVTLVNYLQVYLRISEKLVLLGIFTFGGNALSFVMLYLYFYFNFPLTLSFLLLVHPIALVVLFFCFLIFSNFTFRVSKNKDYPWKAIVLISLKGFYVALVGILFGYFVMFDRIMMSKYSTDDGRFSYIFFTIFGGICITVSGYVYQAVFRNFFYTSSSKVKNSIGLVKAFIVTTTLFVISYYFMILVLLANFYPTHFIHWKFLGASLLIALTSLTIGFVNQYFLANFDQKKILMLNVLLIGTYVLVLEFLFKFDYLIIEPQIVAIFAAISSSIYLEILRHNLKFPVWCHAVHTGGALILLSGTINVN